MFSQFVNIMPYREHNFKQHFQKSADNNSRMKPDCLDALRKGLVHSLGADSDGGDAVTSNEATSLKMGCAEVPPAFIDDLALMMNTREDNILLSADEVRVLEEKYPQVTKEILENFAAFCFWPKNFRIFSSEAVNLIGGSCAGRMETVVNGLHTMGFDAEEYHVNLIRSMSTPDQRFVRTKASLELLEKAHPGSFAPQKISEFLYLMENINNPAVTARIEALATSSATAFARFTSQNFDRRINLNDLYNDHFMNLISVFGDSPETLLPLKDHPEAAKAVMGKMDDPPDPVEIKPVLLSMGRKDVQALIKKMKAETFWDIQAVVQMANSPSLRDDVLVFIRRTKANFLILSEIVATATKTPVLWENLKTIARDCPGVWRFLVTDNEVWLASNDATDLIKRGLHIRIYNALRSNWGLKKITIDDICDILALGEEGVQLVGDKSFRARIEKMRRIYKLGDGDWSSYAIAQYLSLGAPTIDNLLTAEGEAKVRRLLVVNPTDHLMYPWPAIMIIFPLAAIPGAAEAIAAAVDILGHPLEGWELKILRTMIEDEHKRAVLTDPMFQDICKKLKDSSPLPAIHKPIDLIAFIELFEATSPEDRKGLSTRLFSDDFKRVFQDIVKRFEIKDLAREAAAYMLPPILEMSATYNPATIEDLFRRVGRKPRANDLVLLNLVANNPEWQRLLFDRAALEHEAQDIYTRAARPRKNPKKVMLKKGYTERPPIKELDNLALLQLVLLNRALGDDRVISEIGAIAGKDIRDRLGEYGGKVDFSGGRITFKATGSEESQNGGYSSPFNGLFTGGLWLFHLHAIAKDTSDFSGPSGSEDSGDLADAEHGRRTDIVITTCGRAENEPDKLWVNLDMYYYDDQGSARIIDLGLFKVPVFI